MTTNNHDKPVDEVRLGRITATIWRNRTTDEGIFYSTQITRLFRRGRTGIAPLHSAATTFSPWRRSLT